ncbi:MAG: xanthine dehydrogenase family protein subunit M [Chloroflexota bacterium]|nr:xanthine dehydrogenase family protein subunit M [Chloroflexota bacterium]
MTTYLDLLKAKTVDKALDRLNQYWVEDRQLDYFNAATIDEALALLDRHEGARVIAGGVDVVRLLRNRLIAPTALVNIQAIPGLATITEDAVGLKIGTLATLSDIADSPVIKGKYPLLAEAARSAASPAVRNMATIGGNLCQQVNCWYFRMPAITGKTFFCHRKGGPTCFAVDGDNRYHAIFASGKCHAVCQSDLAPALVALDAKIKIASTDGQRVISVEELYTPIGNTLKANELITGIEIPLPAPETKQSFLKFRIRKAIDPAIVSVAAAVTVHDGLITDARIALGGVAPTPYRSLAAEDALKGSMLTAESAQAAAAATVRQAAPLSMNDYKLAIARALVKRAIIG